MSGGGERIPKTLVQTWKTHDLDPAMAAARATWLDANPEYGHQLHVDGDCRAFIRSHYAPVVLEAYDTLRPGAYKADLWRYCYLYIHGGVFADIDTCCRLPLREVLADGDGFVSALTPTQCRYDIWQGFLAAREGHPFLAAAIAQVVTNTQHAFYGRNSVWPTGPAALGIAINRLAGLADLHPYVAGGNERCGEHFRLLDRPHKSKEIQMETGQVCIHAKYDGYLRQVEAQTIGYRQAWRDREVYEPRRNSLWKRLLQRKADADGRMPLAKRLDASRLLTA